MPRQLRIAQIGAGGIGRTHAASFKGMKGAELAAIVDLDEARAKALQDTHAIPSFYSDYREVLKRDDIDIVNICLPTWLHEEIAIAAAQAGKHILCEKPMTLTIESAERMLEAADKAGVKLMVAFCRRFDNEWLKMRELIQAGALGKGLVWRSLHARRGGHQPWFVQKGRGEGPLMDGAIHNFDFARFVWGEARSVVASTKSYREDATAADTGNAIIQFESGDDLVISWSWGLPVGARGATANDIIGPKGALFFNRNERPDLADLKPLAEGQGAIYIDRGAEGIEQHVFTKNDMYHDEMQALIDAIHQGKPSPIDGLEGLKAVAISRAALDSGEKGRPVELVNGGRRLR